MLINNTPGHECTGEDTDPCLPGRRSPGPSRPDSGPECTCFQGLSAPLLPTWLSAAVSRVGVPTLGRRRTGGISGQPTGVGSPGPVKPASKAISSLDTGPTLQGTVHSSHCSKKCKVTKHIRGRNDTDLTKRFFSFKWLFGTFKCCLLVITQLSEE